VKGGKSLNGKKLTDIAKGTAWFPKRGDRHRKCEKKKRSQRKRCTVQKDFKPLRQQSRIRAIQGTAILNRNGKIQKGERTKKKK